jgi:hypothetical protein
LVWNAPNVRWEAQQLALSGTFLTNVSLNQPGPYEVLTWNAATSRYEPQLSGAGMIQGYGQPIPALTSKLIATGTTGAAMLIDVWGRSATGTSFVQVAVSRGAGTDSAHTTVYDVRVATAPVLSFSSSVVAGIRPTDPPRMDVFVSSNVALLEIKGKIRWI